MIGTLEITLKPTIFADMLAVVHGIGDVHAFVNMPENVNIESSAG